MNAEATKAGRLRTLMQHAPKVKTYDELVNFAMGKFMVTRRTAEDYTDNVIEYFKQVEQRKKNK